MHKQQGGHAAAYQVPVCWNLDFNWAPWYCTNIYLWTVTSDWHKTGLAPDSPGRDYFFGSGTICI